MKALMDQVIQDDNANKEINAWEEGS